jgi:hypothetical protein
MNYVGRFEKMRDGWLSLYGALGAEVLFGVL